MRFAPDYLAMAPVLVLALGAVLVLVVDAVRPRLVRVPWTLAGLCSLGSAVVAARPLLPDAEQPSTLCLSATRCLYEVDRPGALLQTAAALATLVVVALAAPIPGDRGRAPVQASLLLASAAGASGVIAARDLGSWLVLLELATLPAVALVALRARRSSVDGAFMLLTTSLLSFGLLAMGAALWVTATGSPLLLGDAVLSAANDPQQRRILTLAVVMLLAGLAFKLSLVPFHSWTPEAYAGASLPIGGFLATTAKFAALGALLAVLRGVTALGDGALLVIAVLAAVSMTLGNVLALRETSTLRLLGWSTVAQAGWVVLPLATVSPGAVAASAGYLVVISLGTLGVFGALTLVAHADGRESVRSLEDLRGSFRRRPLAGVTLALSLLVLAGLPPALSGLAAKVAVLRPVVSGDLWWLAVVAAVNVVLGVAVYLRLIAATAGRAPERVRDRTSRVHVGVVGVLLLAIVVTGVLPQSLLDLLPG